MTIGLKNEEVPQIPGLIFGLLHDDCTALFVDCAETIDIVPNVNAKLAGWFEPDLVQFEAKHVNEERRCYLNVRHGENRLESMKLVIPCDVFGHGGKMGRILRGRTWLEPNCNVASSSANRAHTARHFRWHRCGVSLILLGFPKPSENETGHQERWPDSLIAFTIFGGDEEDRTPDLRIANATLSQLSYAPTNA